MEWAWSNNIHGSQSPHGANMKVSDIIASTPETMVQTVATLNCLQILTFTYCTY